jgi:hypothetical protein
MTYLFSQNYLPIYLNQTTYLLNLKNVGSNAYLL